jgi:hypothetical protein
VASALYPKAKESFISANPVIDMDTDNIKISLMSSSYTYNSAHQYHSSLTGIVATSANLGSKTVTNGVFDAADVTLTAVSGSAVNAIVVWKDTGTSGTSPLVAYIDGISVTPNGGDITVAWDNGANKIFAL